MIYLLILLLNFTAIHAIDADAALKILKEGNERFTSSKMINCNFPEKSRSDSFEQQQPFAIIVACSDSRVSPEIIFDQSLGQIFVVRVAGNVVTDVEQDSVDFAALYLKATLIVVLGHESCGAVKAVMANQTEDIPAIGAWIKKGITQGASLEEAIKQNVRHGIKVIENAPALQPLLKEKTVKIVGAYYRLKEGQVEFF